MPYREGPRVTSCHHCGARTARACVRCAHAVCEACEAKHDAEFPHKDYTG